MPLVGRLFNPGDLGASPIPTAALHARLHPHVPPRWPGRSRAVTVSTIAGQALPDWNSAVSRHAFLWANDDAHTVSGRRSAGDANAGGVGVGADVDLDILVGIPGARLGVSTAGYCRSSVLQKPIGSTVNVHQRPWPLVPAAAGLGADLRKRWGRATLRCLMRMESGVRHACSADAPVHATLRSLSAWRSACVEVIPAAVFAHEAAVFGHAHRAAAADAVAGQEHHLGGIGAGDSGALHGEAEPGGPAAFVQR